jgi:hypothetical protein
MVKRVVLKCATPVPGQTIAPSQTTAVAFLSAAAQWCYWPPSCKQIIKPRLADMQTDIWTLQPVLRNKESRGCPTVNERVLFTETLSGKRRANPMHSLT